MRDISQKDGLSRDRLQEGKKDTLSIPHKAEQGRGVFVSCKMRTSHTYSRVKRMCILNSQETDYNLSYFVRRATLVSCKRPSFGETVTKQGVHMLIIILLIDLFNSYMKTSRGDIGSHKNLYCQKYDSFKSII